DFKDLESKPSDPLNIYVDIPYKQDFLRINNSWSINNTKGYYKYSPVYSDPNENLVNETGFIYYGLGHDNIMYSDRIISPLFDLSKNKDALIRFDYTFITDNSNNNLTIGYRISPTEEWKNFFVLPQTDNARIYRSIVIDIPAEAKTIGTQFSVYFNNENNSQNSIVRIDNFEIKKFDNKESQIELISDFTNGNANLSWNSDEIENVEYYNVYRNLKLVGQTKDNYFIDSTIRSDKTYYFTVRSCTKRDNIGSVPSNSVTVNPNPLFTIPYNQTFNNSNNIQWLVDDVFWKYIKNKNFGVNTNNVTPFYGFNIDNIQSQLNDSWLSSPIFQIQEFNDISLSFEYIYKIYDVEGNQSLGIYYKTTKADNWILIKNLNRTISSSNWQLIDFFLPEELEGEKFQIGFKISNESQNSNLMLVGIDNFRIFSKKGLLQPINFNVVSNENAVELNWMAAEGSNPSKYKVYKNDSLIAETNSTFYKDIIDQVDQKYIYKITAIYSGPVFGESLPVINELLKNNFSLPYYIDFENGYEGWDISGNSIGWKWNNNSDMDEHKYIFTEFPAIPSEDLVKSNYFYLDFPGTVSISYDYSFFGQENQYFSLLYRNVLDSVWTVLQEMQVNSLSSLQTFTNCTFILPPEACRKNIQFAFSFRNESSVAANAAIDYFKIDVLKGIYTPEKLEYFVNNEFIGLNWNRPKERAPEYYNIYKNDSLINSSKSPNYYDYNVINGVTYTYKITAVYSGINSGESFPTNQVRVVPVAYKEVPYFQEFNDNGNDWLFSEKDTDFRLLTADEADFGEENTSKFVGVKTKNPLETWLMSPLFNVTAETNVFLTFEYFFKNYYIFNELNIYYRHSPQGEWTNLCEIEPSDNTWKNFELQLPEELLADSLQLAIVFINNRKSASFSECGIDNVGLFEKTGEKPLLIKSFDFNVYPNPSNGIIEVNFDFESETNEELIIDVIDINGRVIYNNSIRSNGFESVINLDLTRQIKGIYYLRVYSVGKVHSKKIIIS
ncbi:T9SS type A sorting domain-containing protein, partial [Bacteroidota bacterium]